MAKLDIQKLSRLVRQKRGGKNLRSVAEEIEGVSISTLSRIEQGKVPDLSTFLKICSWLDMSPNDFALGFQEDPKDKKEEILYHLRTDTTLSKEVADTLKKVIEMAYLSTEALTSSEDEKRI